MKAEHGVAEHGPIYSHGMWRDHKEFGVDAHVMALVRWTIASAVSDIRDSKLLQYSGRRWSQALSDRDLKTSTVPLDPPSFAGRPSLKLAVSLSRP